MWYWCSSTNTTAFSIRKQLLAAVRSTWLLLRGNLLGAEHGHRLITAILHRSNYDFTESKNLCQLCPQIPNMLQGLSPQIRASCLLDADGPSIYLFLPGVLHLLHGSHVRLDHQGCGRMWHGKKKGGPSHRHGRKQMKSMKSVERHSSRCTGAYQCPKDCGIGALFWHECQSVTRRRIGLKHCLTCW